MTPTITRITRTFPQFIDWAKQAGYDTAYTHNEGTPIALNPMTADLWKAWQAASELSVSLLAEAEKERDDAKRQLLSDIVQQLDNPDADLIAKLTLVGATMTQQLGKKKTMLLGMSGAEEVCEIFADVFQATLESIDAQISATRGEKK